MRLLNGFSGNNPAIADSSRRGWAWKRVRPFPIAVLSDVELAAIWNACDDGSDHSKIVRLLILTGCRRDEIGGMRWSEFDESARTWKLPRERSKNKHELELTLPAMAWSIIESVERRQFSEFLFGTRGEHGANNWFKPKQALDQRIGFKNWRLHDLRRTVATGMAEGRWLSKAEKNKERTGIHPHIVEAVLNHRGGHKAGIAGVYNRSSYEREVRNALAIWADHVANIVSGEKRKILQFPAEAQDRA